MVANGQAVLEALETSRRVGRRIYEGFAGRRLELWDEVIAPDVEVRSTVGQQPMHGLAALKAWADAFSRAFAARIDLVDEMYAVGRAAIGVNLHWRHREEFFGLAPTGREGTSIEYLLMWIDGGLVVRLWVADHTLDLTTYLTRERGMPYPQCFRPHPIISGSDPLQGDREAV